MAARVLYKLKNEPKFGECFTRGSETLAVRLTASFEETTGHPGEAPDLHRPPTVPSFDRGWLLSAFAGMTQVGPLEAS